MHTNGTDQVLERLPNGELAWLRLDPARVVIEDPAPQFDSEDRFWLTDDGRRALRMAELFGTEAIA